MDMCMCSVLEGMRVGEERGLGVYREVARFHYRCGRPRGVTGVLVARSGEGRVMGVAVVGLPALNCRMRRAALPGRYEGLGRREGAVKVNGEVRAILRLVVLPVFRGLGVGERLVREVLMRAEVPYVEALAAMGRVHPVFERAGMEKFEGGMGAEAVRLVGVLSRHGVGMRELMLWRGESWPGEVCGALRRFARGKGGGIGGWVREARERAWSWPVYYLWRGPQITQISQRGEGGISHGRH